MFISIKLVRIFSSVGLFRGGQNRKIDHYAEIFYGRGKDIASL